MFKGKVINQEGLKDCGPTCLAMIVEHYKGYIHIEELKEMCKTTKKGTNAFYLIEAAKQLGFEASGVKIMLEQIDKQNVILPCIAHVTIGNSYNHFVVIEKIDFKKKKLIVKDPANGRKTYTYEEFNNIYNSVIINLYPLKTIPYNEKYKISDFLKKLIHSSKKQLIQLIIISIFITIFSIIASFYVQNMVDNILFGINKIYFIFGIFVIVYIFKIISDFLRNQILVLINEKISLNLTYNAFKQIILLPYCYYRNHTTGEIISRINDLEVVRQVISKVSLSLFIDLPLTIVALVIIFFMNINLFIISIIMLLSYLFAAIIFHKPFNQHVDVCQNEKAIATSYMVESINGFETIKGCNAENKTIKSFEYKYSSFLEKMFKFDRCYNKQYVLKELINNLGFLIIFLVGIILVKEGKITLGLLLSFNALLTYFLEPIRNIIDLDSSIKQAKNSIKKVMNIFRKKADISILDKPLKGDILFNGLTYKFSEEKLILDNVDLSIKQGAKVLLHGTSGSGKSTICKILKKYYEVERNKVLIDDIDINDYKKSDIIYVSQNEILFTDTIFNNIDSDNILDISKICLVDEIVNNMNLGYQTLIEENGFNISGGQKQRIVLARALANAFNILIIDEGLSQVDTNMERKILKNIFEKWNNQTIIVVSHRLDNMDLFDQVIKLEKGKIIYNESKNI